MADWVWAALTGLAAMDFILLGQSFLTHRAAPAGSLAGLSLARLACAGLAFLAAGEVSANPAMVAGLLLCFFYLRLMWHHGQAHATMLARLDADWEPKHEEVEEDLRMGLLDPQQAADKHALLDEQRLIAESILKLGRWSGPLAIVTVGLLLLHPSSGLVWGWLVLICLPSLANSKCQDLTLAQFYPRESLLC